MCGEAVCQGGESRGKGRAVATVTGASVSAGVFVAGGRCGLGGSPGSGGQKSQVKAPARPTSSRGSRHPPARRCPDSSLCAASFCVSVCPRFSYKDLSWGLGPLDSTISFQDPSSHLQRPFFRRRSHSQVPGGLILHPTHPCSSVGGIYHWSTGTSGTDGWGGGGVAGGCQPAGGVKRKLQREEALDGTEQQFGRS